MQKYFKKVLKWSVTFLLIGVSLLIIASCFIYYKKDDVLNQVLNHLNDDFKGLVKIKEADISPFENFPYVSVKLNELKIYESKQTDSLPILNLETAYLGFDFWKIIKNELVIKKLSLQNGEINIVQDQLGLYNIAKAFESRNLTEESKKVETKPLLFNFKSISLKNIAIKKESLVTKILVETNIKNAEASFNKTVEAIKFKLDSKFVLNILNNGKPNYIYHKNLELHTDFVFDKKTHVINFLKTSVLLEGADFDMKGKIDIDDDLFVDLYFSGNKPNFDLVIGFAPEELIPTLKSYKNKGKVFFDAHVKGKTANNQIPAINAKFGCKDGYIINPDVNKKIDKLGFLCTFTNGKDRSNATSFFELKDFNAKPEAGNFKAKLTVNNFDSPEIDLQLDSDFDLDFLTQFFRLKDIKNLSGKVLLTMNFHDIIDLNNPEKSIEKLNESYYTELLIQNLRFKSQAFHLPLEKLDMKATLIGHEAKIEKFDMKMGKSDLHIRGSVSDLPAIIHHSDLAVVTNLFISSKHLDIKELTTTGKDAKPVNEQIDNLSLKLKFKSSAKAITESPNLPIGEFFIEDLYAKMKHYPHTLHDFHADVFIDPKDFRVMDFTGMIDKSDFHFSGKLENYNMWFEEKMQGDTKIEFDLTSNLLQFESLFTYNGEQMLPEDYRHEEIKGLKLHGITELHFNEGLSSTDFKLTQLEGSMKIHPLRFEQFSGKMHMEKGHLSVKQFKGKMGHSNFIADLEYTIDPKKSSLPNSLTLRGSHLDIDELLNYNPPPTTASANSKPVDHDAAFSLYDLQFPDMAFNFDIGHVNYHHHMLDHFKASVRTQKNHMIHLDKFSFDAAGGHFDMKGYLSGKDKKHIYFSPDIRVKNVDLDKFLVKFENFGQDHVVSENLHGKFSGHITGKIHLHGDLVPKLDDSDIKIEMTVLNGRLENYAPIVALADYFQDKNVSKVFFDTLQNTLTLKKSVLKIPAMTINSSIGFMEIRGEQRIDGNMDMDYTIGVPWKMITSVGSQKLFRRKEKDSESDDEIQYRQSNSKFVYIRMTGDLENYKIGLAKKPK